jgi:hypothetical protein
VWLRGAELHPPKGSTPTYEGLVLRPCGEYAEMYRTNPGYTDNIYIFWAQGYISGVNAVMEDTYFDLSAKTTF